MGGVGGWGQWADGGLGGKGENWKHERRNPKLHHLENSMCLGFGKSSLKSRWEDLKISSVLCGFQIGDIRNSANHEY